MMQNGGVRGIGTHNGAGMHEGGLPMIPNGQNMHNGMGGMNGFNAGDQFANASMHMNVPGLNGFGQPGKPYQQMPVQTNGVNPLQQQYGQFQQYPTNPHNSGGQWAR